MMTLRLARAKTKARFLMIGYGLVLIFWMSLEDSSTLTVSLLGTGAAVIYIGIWLLNRLSERELAFRHWFPGMIFSGTLFGAASVLITVILMFFKSGWHGHIYPDYPPQMIFAMLTRLPVWALSGTLTAIFCAILLLLHKAQNQNSL